MNIAILSRDGTEAEIVAGPVKTALKKTGNARALPLAERAQA